MKCPKNKVKNQNPEVWKQTIKSLFPELFYPSLVGASVAAQLLIQDIKNPFSLIYIDVPSSGKTIVLNFFAKLQMSYLTDNFSPKSFVSHATNVSKDKLTKIDMLPQIKNKILIIRELATLFGKRPDDLTECISILTRVLDGQGYSSNSGVHGKRGYEGSYIFMLMAASTPLQPKVWKILGNFGSRLFFCRINSVRKSEKELAKQLNDDWQENEKICQLATNALFQQLTSKYPKKIEWVKNKDDNEAKLVISRCAILLSKLRGVINVWQDQNEDQSILPIIEQPNRINQLLYNLARGHAVLHKRDFITKKDLSIVLNVTLDSAQLSRSKLIKIIINKSKPTTIAEIQKLLKVSDKTAMKEAKKLELLGLVKLKIGVGQQASAINISKKFDWFKTNECKNLLKIEN